MYCGVDLVEIERIARLAKRARFCERIYAADELQLLHSTSALRQAELLAGRFAVKEAVMKILMSAAEEVQSLDKQNHTLAVSAVREQLKFIDIVTLRSPSGAPCLHLRGSLEIIASKLGISRWQLSLSHTKDTAIAFVIAT